MSVVVLDGFDYYTDLTQNWDEVVGATIVPAGGRRNSGYLSLTPAEGSRVSLNVSNSTRATLAFGIRLSYQELAGEGLSVLATLWKDDTWQVCLVLEQSSQLLSVYRNAGEGANEGSGVELLAISNTPLPLDSWHHLEWGVRVNPSADDGSVELRVDGSADKGIPHEVCSSALVTEGFNKVSLGAPDSTGAAMFGVGNFDDAKIAYGTSFVWTGDRRVDFLPLTGNSTPQDWQASAGNAWEALNGAGYVQAGHIADQGFFVVGNLPYAPTAIHSVQAIAQAQGELSLALIARSGESETSTTFALSPSPKLLRAEMRKDPATDAAWTLAGLNDLELGLQWVYSD